jgi:hypothetical protein
VAGLGLGDHLNGRAAHTAGELRQLGRISDFLHGSLQGSKGGQSGPGEENRNKMRGVNVEISVLEFGQIF